MQTSARAHRADRLDSFRVRKEKSVLADQKRRRLARNRGGRHDVRKLCDYTRARLSRSVPQHRAACLKITEWPSWKGASL